MSYISSILSDCAEVSVFTFKNEIQKELWEKELTGQISDGYWENTKIQDGNFGVI